jgi:hypothetical protein
MDCTAWRLIVVAAAAGAALSACAQAPSPDPDFRPVLVGVDFTSREVLPGDELGYTIRFRNEGTKPAKGDYIVFVHFEAPEPACQNIVFQQDHAPTQPTSTWQPGQIASDGPHVVRAPTDRPEQEYHVHLGVFSPQPGGGRFFETYAGKIKVTTAARASSDWQPASLPAAEVEQRRQALRKRLTRPVALETPAWKFELDQDSGAFLLTDKQTGVVWSSNPDWSRFGEASLRSADRRVTVSIERFDRVRRDGERLVAEVDLPVDGKPSGVRLRVIAESLAGGKGLRFRCEHEEKGPWHLEAVRALDRALFTTDADGGYTVIPYRLGVMLPTDRGLPATRTYWTYDGITMAMCGAVKQDSALLVAWPHVDTELQAHTSAEDSPIVPGRRTQSLSLVLQGEAREFELYPLGKGGYVDIAAAYRDVARQRGWRVTWAEKQKQCAWAGQMAGAADFKPFVLGRSVAHTQWNRSDQDQVSVGYTFDEVAQCAEHWKNDLDLGRAMVVLAGWIHRGYDNQHPDILPACPECGGNERLADCARRVKACGYLFGLHDNYQDMYRDAPSWDEKYLNKDARGVSRRGGEWAGGQAWQVCATQQVALAQRNLPQVKALCGPTIYFIDTTFAWGLVTCEDPAHPMTRTDDLKYKTELCRLAQQHFGCFGSEEGREWAVACADYLEGLFSHKCGHPVDEIVVPLFPLVYGDCVNLYTHQSDRLGPGDSRKVLDHVLYAQMPVYNFGAHVYFKEATATALPVRPEVVRFEPVGPRKFRLTYRWHVTGPLTQDYSCFVHGTHSAATRPEKISFQDDHALQPPTSQWQPGQTVEIGPHEITLPEAMSGEWELLVGLLDKNGARQELSGLGGQGGRHKLGVVKLVGDRLEFEAQTWPADNLCFARGDDGWAAGLNVTDRLIKNTYEVLSPLQRLAASTAMAGHEFLTVDRSVERTRFGDVTVTGNYGEQPFEVGETLLPQFGFLVTGPTFVAFHATRHEGIEYPGGALFTLRSLDGRPLAQSEQVRVFHGFGPAKLKLGGKVIEVQREQVVSAL